MTINTVQDKVKIFTEMIKFEHTIFALPFAYLGAFLAVQGVPTFYHLFWITLAMIGARTSAMALNRLIDRHIDGRNPRTEERAIPKGSLSTKETWLFIILSLLLLFVSAAMLNPLAVKLLPIAVFFLVIYSYTKRFTWLCHVVLGIAIGLAPAGAWVGVVGSLDLPAVLLGLAVAFWVAGFDIIYSCQDYKFDKEDNLKSIPVKFGIAGALKISAFFHVIAPILLLSVAFILNLGLFYLIGVIISIALLYYEHRLISPNNLSKVKAAFFNTNGILSVIMFMFTLLDLWIPIKIF